MYRVIEQIGRRIIEHGGLVDVQVQSLVGLHLDGRLHAPGRESFLGGIRNPHLLTVAADLREAALLEVVLLRIVVAGHPPGRMVTGEGEFRQFFPDVEIHQFVLQREFVPEAEAVVVQAEPDVHRIAEAVLQGDQGFVVMVPDLVFLSPYGRPGLVQAVLFDTYDGKSVRERRSVRQVESEPAREHDILPAPFESVIRTAGFGKAELKRQSSVRAGQEGFIQAADRFVAGNGQKKGGRHPKYHLFHNLQR